MSFLKKLDQKLDKLGRTIEGGLDDATKTVDHDLQKGAKDAKKEVEKLGHEVGSADKKIEKATK